MNENGKKIRSAEILCVGTELLMGHTLNTNAGYIARQLADMGIPSYRQIVVGDNPDRLLSQSIASAQRSDLVIFTGGLGPTVDDITMEIAAKAAGKKLVLHEDSLQRIKEHFQSLNRTMSENNKKQAFVPEGAVIFENTNGTAPGVMFTCPAPTETDPAHSAVFILFPGPPSELIPMFTLSAQAHLEKCAPYRLKTEYVHLIGIGESAAETAIRDLIDKQINPTIAPYAAEGECMFRVTQRLEGENPPDLLTPVLNELKNRFGEHIYEIGTRSMKEVVFDLLKEGKKTVSFAESCTAGMVSTSLGDIPGASAVFAGSVVSYENRIKENVLGVSSEILKIDGAVSENCAAAMAEGCRKLMETDISVSITGIAGPDGGTEDKPVGLVYLAISDENGTIVERHQLKGNRMRIRNVSALQAFNLIRKRLTKKK